MCLFWQSYIVRYQPLAPNSPPLTVTPDVSGLPRIPFYPGLTSDDSPNGGAGAGGGASDGVWSTFRDCTSDERILLRQKGLTSCGDKRHECKIERANPEESLLQMTEDSCPCIDKSVWNTIHCDIPISSSVLSRVPPGLTDEDLDFGFKIFAVVIFGLFILLCMGCCVSGRKRKKKIIQTRPASERAMRAGVEMSSTGQQDVNARRRISDSRPSTSQLDTYFVSNGREVTPPLFSDLPPRPGPSTSRISVTPPLPSHSPPTVVMRKRSSRPSRPPSFITKQHSHEQQSIPLNESKPPLKKSESQSSQTSQRSRIVQAVQDTFAAWLEKRLSSGVKFIDEDD